MAQVNVTYPEDLVAALDRVAAARRVSRPELLRAIALEAVEAHEAGRLAFRPEDGPRLDVSISALVVQLREALTECARMQNENIRFQKRLQEAFTGSEETVRAALEKVWTHVRKLNADSFRPFEVKLGGLAEHLEAAEERAQAAVAQDLQEIHERLDRVLEAASKARVEHNLILGDDRTLSFKFLLRMSTLWAVLSILLFITFAEQVRPVALFVAEGMVDSEDRLCLLINRRTGRRDCQLPGEDRKRALSSLAAEARDRGRHGDERR